ncbi:hypothetical protein [Treponema zioleckii]|uniref:hypothetical protein n=1 Tax=Treponema zioleckii TaxID=331680 RepID=UPI00168B0863|nr:hypothetical protein [Treponema zioleckii]
MNQKATYIILENSVLLSKVWTYRAFGSVTPGTRKIQNKLKSLTSKKKGFFCESF